MNEEIEYKIMAADNEASSEELGSDSQDYAVEYTDNQVADLALGASGSIDDMPGRMAADSLSIRRDPAGSLLVKSSLYNQDRPQTGSFQPGNRDADN